MASTEVRGQTLDFLFRPEVTDFRHLDPRHAQLQKDLLDTFHMAHESWISHLATEFAKNLSSALAKTKWDDTCPEILLWNKFADDIVLPTQATNDIEATIYQVCKEVQRVNSSLLDKVQWACSQSFA